MKKIFFCLLLISFSMLAKAQSDSSWRFKRNNVFTVELGSPSNIYTVNYERLLWNKKRFKTFIEIGAFYFPEDLPQYCAPINANQLFSITHNCHLEIGLGSVFGNFQNFNFPLKNTDQFYRTNNLSYTPFSKIGLRYQNNNEKFVGKIGAILFLNQNSNFETLVPVEPTAYPPYFLSPSFYLAVGFSF